MAQVDKLMFTVGMVDKLTGPLRDVQKTVNRVATEAERGFDNIHMGIVGLISSGNAIGESLQSVKEIYGARGKVRSLTIADMALDRLTKTTLDFSMVWGESVSIFIQAVYGIKSAVVRLSGSKLSGFTESFGILAGEAGLYVVTITSYLNALYRVYHDTAKKMGKISIAERFTSHMPTTPGRKSVPFYKKNTYISDIAASFNRGLIPAVSSLFTLISDMDIPFSKLIRKYTGIDMSPVIALGTELKAIIAIITYVKKSMDICSIAMKIFTLAFWKKTAAVKISSAALIAYNITLSLLSKSIRIIEAVMIGFKFVMWAVNVAMTANPIGAVIVGISALITAVAALIIYWEELVGWLTDLSWVKSIGSAFNWLIEQLNLIPGIDISTGIKAANTANTEPLAISAKTNLPAGGIGQQITNAVSNQNHSQKSNITINTNQPVNAVKNEMLMQFG